MIDHRQFPDRAGFEAELDRALRRADIELICLAGFMRILTPSFVAALARPAARTSTLPCCRPSPACTPMPAPWLPACACTAAPCIWSGAALDDGPILVQGVVPVLPGDDAGTLAARVLEVEHRCYPLALEQLASGSVIGADDRVTAGPRLVLHPTLGDP